VKTATQRLIAESLEEHLRVNAPALKVCMSTARCLQPAAMGALRTVGMGLCRNKSG
jgi:hypothetical protein